MINPDNAPNYRVGSIVYMLLDATAFSRKQELIWLRAKSSIDVAENYGLADRLELMPDVENWIKTTGMTPRRTYYGHPLCIELIFKDEVDAQLFCLAFNIT